MLLLCVFGYETSATGVRRAATITLHTNSHSFCKVSILEYLDSPKLAVLTCHEKCVAAITINI